MGVLVNTPTIHMGVHEEMGNLLKGEEDISLDVGSFSNQSRCCLSKLKKLKMGYEKY